jgi:hypothetical protein
MLLSECCADSCSTAVTFRVVLGVSHSIGAVIAAIRPLPANRRDTGVIVTIAGGDYRGEDNRLALGPGDSGLPSAPIVFQADPHDPTPGPIMVELGVAVEAMHAAPAWRLAAAGRGG